MHFFFALVFLTTLSPGDGIVIRSTNYKELNDTIIVLGDTTAELPYIGRIFVGDLTEENIRNFFVETYSKYLKEPDIAVYVVYRVSVIGRVGRPGIYYLPSFATLGDLMAIAGGPFSDALTSKIKIHTKSGEKKISLKSALNKSLTLKDLGICSGSVVEVPKKLVISLEDIYKFAATTGILWSVYRDIIKR